MTTRKIIFSRGALKAPTMFDERGGAHRRIELPAGTEVNSVRETYENGCVYLALFRNDSKGQLCLACRLLEPDGTVKLDYQPTLGEALATQYYERNPTAL